VMVYASVYYIKDPGFVAIPSVFIIFLSTLMVRSRLKKNNERWAGLGVVSVGVGYLLWNLDRHRILCDPLSIFQGHAVFIASPHYPYSAYLFIKGPDIIYPERENKCFMCSLFLAPDNSGK